MQIAMVSMHTSPADRPGTGDAGGLNVYVLESAHALAELGHDVDLFTRSPGKPITRRLHPHVTLYALETGGGVVRKHDLANLTDEFGQELQRVAIEAAEPYEAVHAHYWLSGLAALPVSLALGIPLVQTFHTLAATKPSSEHEPERRALTERYLAGEADAIVAVSGWEASSVIERLGVSADKTWVVQPGVDAQRFAPQDLASHDDVRARLGVQDEQSLIVVAGRVQRIKGQELAVRMLAAVDDAVLVIAGEAPPGDQPYLDGLHDVAREVGVADRVRFVGGLDRDALARLLAAASIVVVPSLSETFCIAAIEAAACGTPVVAADVGGLREAVVHGVTGVLVAGRDPLDWARACRELLDDPARRADLSDRARALAADRTWARAAIDLDRIYRTLG